MLFVAIATPNQEDHWESYFAVFLLSPARLRVSDNKCGDRKEKDEDSADLAKDDHPSSQKNSSGLENRVVNSAFFPTETDTSIKILAFQAALEQFGAIFTIFMLLEQPGTRKHNCIKTAQYAQMSHPCLVQACLFKGCCEAAYSAHSLYCVGLKCSKCKLP